MDARERVAEGMTVWMLVEDEVPVVEPAPPSGQERLDAPGGETPGSASDAEDERRGARKEDDHVR